MNGRQISSTTENSARQAFRPAGAFLRYVVLLLLVGLVPLAGALAVRIQAPQIEREAYGNLQAIVALKGEQIERWFDERYNDATAIMSSAAFARLAQSVEASSGEFLRVDVRPNLIVAVGLIPYHSALLVDVNGRPLLALGGRENLSPETRKLLPGPHSLIGHPVFSDLIVDADGYRHIDLIVPLADSEKIAHEAMGFVVLSLAPEDFLFPYLQSWPTASVSGETFLVRKEHDSVLYLSELRQRARTALNLRVPLVREDLAAVMAVREARAGLQ